MKFSADTLLFRRSSVFHSFMCRTLGWQKEPRSAETDKSYRHSNSRSFNFTCCNSCTIISTESLLKQHWCCTLYFFHWETARQLVPKNAVRFINRFSTHVTRRISSSRSQSTMIFWENLIRNVFIYFISLHQNSVRSKLPKLAIRHEVSHSPELYPTLIFFTPVTLLSLRCKKLMNNQSLGFLSNFVNPKLQNVKNWVYGWLLRFPTPPPPRPL